MLPDFGIPNDDVATQEALRAIEIERVAREAYEVERVARETFEAGEVAREAAAVREAARLREAAIAETTRLAGLQLTRSSTVSDLAMLSMGSPGWQGAQAITDSPALRMMRGIDESPTARMLLEFENSPTVRMMRKLEESSVMRMMRQIDESPAVQLSRSIAENIKLLDSVARLSSAPPLGGVLEGARIVADIAGVAALHDWSAGLRLRELGIASSLITPQLGAFSTLTDVSRHLIEQVNAVSGFAAFPSYLQIAPTLESYASASTLHLFLPLGTDVSEIHVIDLLAEDMLDGVTEEFEARLASVDQGLLKPVRGAWKTALSDTEDRVRQSAASIRFVVEEMIKLLAPREQADTWAHSVGCSKKPPVNARTARSAGKWTVQLRFIMRHVDAFAESENEGSVFGCLADVDLIDMLLLLERLNQAVHDPEAHIPEEDLALVLRRVMAFMTLLLDAYEFETPKHYRCED
ncbi:MAG: hypothetical protein ACREPM_02150 [Gemmatimonadaceae bacterium]